VNYTTYKTLLVGDNPFHGISHLSQERGRARGTNLNNSEYAANLIARALENGANGFMFSVSETTLSILKEIREKKEIERLSLYSIVPYAHEYVQLANQLGGILGLAKRFSKEIIKSKNVRAAGMGLKGLVRTDPVSLMRAYSAYEISRIKSASGKKGVLSSVLLHQVITDMCLALNLDWVFKSYVDFMLKSKIIPGFNTGNFTYLVSKFTDWNIDLRELIIAAPFNKIGFQMTPSIKECEKALENLPKPAVIAISVLAAGYLPLREATEYIATLPNIKGIAIGVSKENHAKETFKFLRETFQGSLADSD
jgi:hypothetical protein